VLGSTTVQVPALADVPPTSGDTTQDARPSYWGAQRIAGATLVGGSLVGLTVGSVFGAITLNEKSQSLALCQPKNPMLCSAAGVTLRNEAYSAADVSTVAFIVGGVLLAGGLTTFFTTPSAAPKPSAGLDIQVRPTIAWGSAGVSLRGGW
jgi:hypothetical protein